MIWPQLQAIAEIVIGRILNSLPEGLLIATFTWVMLRLLPRQNSGTRFAVWFVAFAAVCGLPVVGVPLMGLSAEGHPLAAAGASRSLITLPRPWGLLLFGGWAVAACAGLVHLATGLWRLRGLRRSGIAIDPLEIDPVIRRTISEFSSSRSATLATSEKVSVPAAIGFFKPMIVIPAWALRELPPEELNIIVLHEIAHLRRWDDWTNLLQKVVRAVFFFQPAVWWIESRLSLEREMACDDQVIAATANPRGYAKCLVAFLEKSFARRSWAMAQAAVHRAREASLRLAQILDTSRPNTKHVWKPALGIVSAFSLVCLAVVPHAPELVAFEQNSPAIHTGDVETAALGGTEFSAAHVIPAVLHLGASPALSRQKREAGGNVIGRAVGHPVAKHPSVEQLSFGGPGVEHTAVENRANGYARPAPKIVAAIGNTNIGNTNHLLTAGAEPNEAVVPQQTLLVVRTTQRVGQNSWVWSVSVWRVTLLSPVQDEAPRPPSAKKT